MTASMMAMAAATAITIGEPSNPGSDAGVFFW